MEQRQREELESIGAKQSREGQDRGISNEREIEKLSTRHTEEEDRQRKQLASIEKRLDRSLNQDAEKQLKKYATELKQEFKVNKEQLKRVRFSFFSASGSVFTFRAIK